MCTNCEFCLGERGGAGPWEVKLCSAALALTGQVLRYTSSSRCICSGTALYPAMDSGTCAGLEREVEREADDTKC